MFIVPPLTKKPVVVLPVTELAAEATASVPLTFVSETPKAPEVELTVVKWFTRLPAAAMVPADKAMAPPVPLILVSVTFSVPKLFPIIPVPVLFAMLIPRIRLDPVGPVELSVMTLLAAAVVVMVTLAALAASSTGRLLLYGDR